MSAGSRAARGEILPGAARSRAARERNRGGAGARSSLSVGQRHISQQPRLLAISVAIADRDAQTTTREDQTQQVSYDLSSLSLSLSRATLEFFRGPLEKKREHLLRWAKKRRFRVSFQRSFSDRRKEKTEARPLRNTGVRRTLA